mmetsp:Transcript_16040/g.38342  ORF Transcript_16040/g.38342 Transcript_16040/m.38342 type:complete len:240 (-) Transcript_16040:692-1411(-)
MAGSIAPGDAFSTPNTSAGVPKILPTASLAFPCVMKPTASLQLSSEDLIPSMANTPSRKSTGVAHKQFFKSNAGPLTTGSLSASSVKPVWIGSAENTCFMSGDRQLGWMVLILWSMSAFPTTLDSVPATFPSFISGNTFSLTSLTTALAFSTFPTNPTFTSRWTSSSLLDILNCGSLGSNLPVMLPTTPKICSGIASTTWITLIWITTSPAVFVLNAPDTDNAAVNMMTACWSVWSAIL